MNELIIAIAKHNRHPEFYSKNTNDKGSAQAITMLIRKSVMDSVMTAMANHTMYPTLKSDACNLFGAIYSYILVGTRTEEVNDSHSILAKKMRKAIGKQMTSAYRTTKAHLAWGPGNHGKCSGLVAACQCLTYMILTQAPTNKLLIQNPLLSGGVRPWLGGSQSKNGSDLGFVFLLPPEKGTTWGGSWWKRSKLTHQGGRVCYDNQICISDSTIHPNKQARVICSFPLLSYGIFELASDNLNSDNSTLIDTYSGILRKMSNDREMNNLDADLSNLSFETTESEDEKDDAAEEDEPREKRPKTNKTIPIKDIRDLLIEATRTCERFNSTLNASSQLINTAAQALMNTDSQANQRIGNKLLNKLKNLRTSSIKMDESLVILANQCFKTDHENCSLLLANLALALIKDDSIVKPKSIYDYLDILEESPRYITSRKWKTVQAEDIDLTRFCTAFGLAYHRAFESIHPVSTLSENVVAVLLYDKNNTLDVFNNWSYTDDVDEAEIDSIYNKAGIWESKGWTSNAGHIRSTCDKVKNDMIDESALVYDLIWVDQNYLSELKAAMSENARNRTRR